MKPLTERTYSLDGSGQIKEKMLNWVRPFNIFCFLDSRQYRLPPHRFDCLLAAGTRRYLSGYEAADLDAFTGESGWRFGHLSYNLKRALHHLPDDKPDPAGFPDLYFFEPEILIRVTGDELHIRAPEPDTVFAQLMATPAAAPAAADVSDIRAALDRAAYLDRIRRLQAHIRAGDCYEINFCQAFTAQALAFDPVAAFLRLMSVSPNPFSALYRCGHSWLLCASPERYLAREGGRLLSQPIKGTIGRSPDPEEDRRLANTLRDSAKDRAENVMVVDLVRNDLARICRPGSVQVDELFGIYAFPQVYQMISTISGQALPGLTFSQLLQATFPMGSMTGAPKHRVLQLIDRYEPTARGIFSGAVGYIDPEGNFDLNVVIRSLMFNGDTGRLSWQVGSGITAYSNPEQEWEECELKAAAIKKVLARGPAL